MVVSGQFDFFIKWFGKVNTTHISLLKVVPGRRTQYCWGFYSACCRRREKLFPWNSWRIAEHRRKQKDFGEVCNTNTESEWTVVGKASTEMGLRRKNPLWAVLNLYITEYWLGRRKKDKNTLWVCFTVKDNFNFLLFSLKMKHGYVLICLVLTCTVRIAQTSCSSTLTFQSGVLTHILFKEKPLAKHSSPS